MFKSEPCWVYLLECADGSLYPGIARDVGVRLGEHVAGRGARHTRIHRPVRLLGKALCPNRGTAMRVERRLKRLSAWHKRRWAFREAGGPDPGPPPRPRTPSRKPEPSHTDERVAAVLHSLVEEAYEETDAVDAR